MYVIVGPNEELSQSVVYARLDLASDASLAIPGSHIVAVTRVAGRPGRRGYRTPEERKAARKADTYRWREAHKDRVKEYAKKSAEKKRQARLEAQATQAAV
jgi:hypothetical protein